jgi:Asp-tRNA(Asn)/Glu-tRNA(Gln) amidotransferase A subunit family amidase
VREPLGRGRAPGLSDIRAPRKRNQLRFELEMALSDEVDLFPTPAAPSIAPKIRQPTVQLVGRAYAEATGLQAGYAYAHATVWSQRHPGV